MCDKNKSEEHYVSFVPTLPFNSAIKYLYIWKYPYHYIAKRDGRGNARHPWSSYVYGWMGITDLLDRLLDACPSCVALHLLLSFCFSFRDPELCMIHVLDSCSDYTCRWHCHDPLLFHAQKWGVAPQSPIGRARSVEASYCWFHFWISWGYVGCLWITTRPRGVPACGSWFNSERSTYSATAAEEGQRRPTIGGASSCRIRAAGGRSSNNSRRRWRLWLRPPRKDGVRPSRRPQVAVAVGEGVGNMP